MTTSLVLYVHDLALSAAFYQEVLQQAPRWSEDGGAAFDLPDGIVLGLRSEARAAEQLGDELPDPQFANGTPRGEVRLEVVGAGAFRERALACGARPLTESAPRLDGREAQIALDPDGHVLVFVEARLVAAPTWMERAQAALGPVLAGLILDFFDLLTPGAVGLYVGPLVGFLIGHYLSGFYGFRGWPRVAMAVLAAGYLAAPMTSMLPVATLIGALARFRDPKPRPLGS